MDMKMEVDIEKVSIQELSDKTGYTNSDSFTRAFKKHVGVTPSHYIKNKGKG